MKIKKLSINGSKTLRFKLIFQLDMLNIVIERKLPSAEWVDDYYEKHHNITKETDITELLEKAYDKYVTIFDVEKFWGDALENTSIVEIKDKIEEEKES